LSKREGKQQEKGERKKNQKKSKVKDAHSHPFSAPGQKRKRDCLIKCRNRSGETKRNNKNANIFLFTSAPSIGTRSVFEFQKKPHFCQDF